MLNVAGIIMINVEETFYKLEVAFDRYIRIFSVPFYPILPYEGTKAYGVMTQVYDS